MRALTVIPRRSGSASLLEVPEPMSGNGLVLARTLAIGICGTDREILGGEYGWPVPGGERLVIGHESLAEVEIAPPECGLERGDLVVGIVRHPDPKPCAACRSAGYVRAPDLRRCGSAIEHSRPSSAANDVFHQICWNACARHSRGFRPDLVTDTRKRKVRGHVYTRRANACAQFAHDVDSREAVDEDRSTVALLIERGEAQIFIVVPIA